MQAGFFFFEYSKIKLCTKKSVNGLN